jgi:hypothetical protein
MVTEILFDVSTGEVLESNGTQASITPAGNSQLVPLRDLLLAPEFPFQPGYFEHVNSKEWDRERCVQLGKRTLDIISDEGERRELMYKHFKRLSILGLSPSAKFIASQYATETHAADFSAFKAEVGSPISYSRTRYADWGIMDYVAYAEKIRKKLGTTPRLPDYDALYNAGKGPSPSLIEKHFGGIKRLHEHLGHPDVSDWEFEDYVGWGVRVLDANPGKSLDIHMIPVLAAQRYGPSLWSIDRDCGSWRRFKNAGTAAHMEVQQDRRVKAGEYRTLIASQQLPREFETLSDQELLTSAGKYRIATACLPQNTEKQRIALATRSSRTFTKAIREQNPNISAGEIEVIAASEGVFDDIWPAPLSHLYVPAAEIEARRRMSAETKRRWRQSSKEEAA